MSTVSGWLVGWVVDLSNRARRASKRISPAQRATADTPASRSAQALTDSERRFQTLSEIGIDYSFAIRIHPDGSSERYWITDAFSRITGYRPDDMEVDQWDRIIHPDDLAHWTAEHQRAIREGRASIEYRIRTRDGSWRWIREQSTISPVAGGGHHWFGSCRDISAEREAERARQASERRYRAIAEHSGDVVVEFDRRGKVVYVSPNVGRAFGYAPAEAISKTSLDLVHDDDRRAVAERLNKTLHTGESVQLIYRVRHADGSWCWVESNATAFPTEDDGIRGLLLARDIGESRAAEQALRASEQRHRTLVENAYDLIAELDSNQAFTFASQNYRDLLGYANDELLGRPIADLLHAEDLPPDQRAFFAPGQNRTHRFRHRDATWRWLESHASRIDGPDGPLTIVTSRDVTAKREVEEALRESREQLLHSQKMEAIGRLAGAIAHDFNNLLMAIRGNGELLLDAIGPDHPARTEADEILHAAKRAEHLTRRLLVFSRRDAHQPAVLDLDALVAGLEALLRRLIGADIELVPSLAGGRLRVWADPGQLEQLVMNLAVNARDAMPSGGRLSISTASVDVGPGAAAAGLPAGSYVRLSVQDSGVGMDDETVSRAFEPFFTTKEPERGTGLGLSIVYGIVRQNRGQIRIDSAPGAGSTFSVYFPRIEPARSE